MKNVLTHVLLKCYGQRVHQLYKYRLYNDFQDIADMDVLAVSFGLLLNCGWPRARLSGLLMFIT